MKLSNILEKAEGREMISGCEIVVESDLKLVLIKVFLISQFPYCLFIDLIDSKRNSMDV